MKTAKPADALADSNERMPLFRAVGRALVRILPRNELIFRVARKIVDRNNGDNDFDYNDTFIDSRTQLKDIWQFVLETTSGYGFCKIYPRELRHILEYKQRYESFRYSNWALLRPYVAEAMGVPA